MKASNLLLSSNHESKQVGVELMRKEEKQLHRFLVCSHLEYDERFLSLFSPEDQRWGAST